MNQTVKAEQKKLTEEQLLKKRKYEEKVCHLMINLYCKRIHKTKKGLCSDCKELCDYVSKRIDSCPFMETKTFCSMCNVHCYKNDMRIKIRAVMRSSGPVMIFYHPFSAVRHILLTIREKLK